MDDLGDPVFDGVGLAGFKSRANAFLFKSRANPDLDDRIFYCLLASMAAMQAEDVRASCLWVI